MSRRAQPSLGCGYAVTVLIALVGGVTLFVAAKNHLTAPDDAPPTAVWVPGLIGLALLFASGAYLRFARRTVREHAAEERIRAENPNAPWLWRREWRDEHLACEASMGAGVLWFFALVWNALSLPGLLHVLSDAGRDKAALLILLFPVVGIGLLSAAAYRTIRRRKYGRVRFTPVSLPGLVGGHLGGVVEAPARVVPLGDLRLSLRCIRKTITGSGKNRRAVETVLWESAQRIPPEKLAASANLTTIPVLFEIPADRPASDPDVSENQILWRLSAEADTPGVDFLARFHVPVFPAGGPGLAAPLPPPSSGPSVAAQPIDDAELARHGITRLADGWSFAAPHLSGVRLGYTIAFAACLTLFGVVIACGAHPFGLLATGMPLLVTAIFASDLWQSRCRLRILGEEIIVNDSAWFRPREIRLPRADVIDLHATDSLKVGVRQYQRLILVGRPVGRPPAEPHPAEPFAVRKLRRELVRAKPADQAARLDQLAALPRFEVRCSGHLPAPAFAEAFRHEVLARLTG